MSLKWRLAVRQSHERRMAMAAAMRRASARNRARPPTTIKSNRADWHNVREFVSIIYLRVTRIQIRNTATIIIIVVVVLLVICIVLLLIGVLLFARRGGAHGKPKQQRRTHQTSQVRFVRFWLGCWVIVMVMNDDRKQMKVAKAWATRASRWLMRRRRKSRTSSTKMRCSKSSMATTTTTTLLDRSQRWRQKRRQFDHPNRHCLRIVL